MMHQVLAICLVVFPAVHQGHRPRARRPIWLNIPSAQFYLSRLNLHSQVKECPLVLKPTITSNSIPHSGIPSNTDCAILSLVPPNSSTKTRAHKKSEDRAACSPACPLCRARSSGGVIRRTTDSASASYTAPAAAACIAWTRRELEDARPPLTQVQEGARERSRNSCLRKAGEAAHMRPRCCRLCRHAWGHAPIDW